MQAPSGTVLATTPPLVLSAIAATVLALTACSGTTATSSEAPSLSAECAAAVKTNEALDNGDLFAVTAGRQEVSRANPSDVTVKSMHATGMYLIHALAFVVPTEADLKSEPDLMKQYAQWSKNNGAILQGDPGGIGDLDQRCGTDLARYAELVTFLDSPEKVAVLFPGLDKDPRMVTLAAAAGGMLPPAATTPLLSSGSLCAAASPGAPARTLSRLGGR